MILLLLTIVAAMALSTAPVAAGQSGPPRYISAAIDRAGANRGEISRAWQEVPAGQRPGMAYLLEHMPRHDLQSLTAGFLLENVDLAYVSWQTSPWFESISEQLFLNEILPYCLVTEGRVAWRSILRETCLELVAGAKTPADAAVRLNRELFPRFGVIYSTDRSRTDQNVLQVLEEQKATCTGLSVLLTSACRSVGIPARLVGTPLWADSSGNHSWVEVWDQEWSYTGAAEPAEDRLNDAWFTDRASRAQKKVAIHAVYATSYGRTGTTFPIAWDASVGYVAAINVTDRYTKDLGTELAGTPVRFVAVDPELRRTPTRIDVRDGAGRVVFQGVTKTDRSDLNDHLTAMLEAGTEYSVVAHTAIGRKLLPLLVSRDGEPVVLRIHVQPHHGWGRAQVPHR